MRKTTFIICIFLCLKLSSQNVEFIGGFNTNSYYNLNIWEDYYSTYDTRPGYNIAVGYESSKFPKLRISLGVEKVNGGLLVTESGINTGRRTFAEFEKTVISLNMFLYNFSIYDKFDVNMGFNINRMLTEKFKGTYSSRSGSEGVTSDLNDIYNQYNSTYNYGLILRIAYSFKLFESAYLTVQYYNHLGLSNEFIEFPKSTLSHRNYICLGLKYKFHN